MPEPESSPAPSFIDGHAHLDMERFDADRDVVVERAKNAGLVRIVNVGIDLASSRQSIELSKRYPIIAAAVGIHPQDSKGITKDDIAELRELAQASAVVAIGEIGLDFHHDHSPHEQQLDVLKWQLELAQELNKPVVIHERQAQKETLEVLTAWCGGRKMKTSPGVIHCFSEGLAQGKAYLDLGFYLSVGAYVGYPSSKSLREVVKQLPLERLLIETDSPFLPPQAHRGQRNEPAYVVEAAKAIAEVRGISLQEVARATTQNAVRVFNLK
jgi:TatD DNase family protein